MHKRSGSLLVASTRSASGFGLVALDDRSPSVVMRAGRDFWMDIYSHAGAGAQHRLRATALAVRGSKMALMTEGGSLIAGEMQKSCWSMSCDALDPDVLEFVDDCGLVVFDSARRALLIYDVNFSAPTIRREIKLRVHPRLISCSNGEVRVQCAGDRDGVLLIWPGPPSLPCACRST